MGRGRTSMIARMFRVNSADRRALEQLLRQPALPAGFAKRARIVLDVADGETLVYTSVRRGMSRQHIYKWLARYKAQGIAGLRDKPGRGRWLRRARRGAQGA